MLIRDAELRDNPPATGGDSVMEKIFGQRFAYNANRPEVHEILRGWRRLADSYDPARVLLGETDVHRLDMLPPFYGDGSDELHLAFNLPWLTPISGPRPSGAWSKRPSASFRPGRGRCGPAPISTLPPGHPLVRGEPGTIRCILLALLTLRGTPVIYQGTRSGSHAVLTEERCVTRSAGAMAGRRRARPPERSPLPWDQGPGRGVTTPDAQPWLPMTTPTECNVAVHSTTRFGAHFTRRPRARRRANPDLHSGTYRSQPSPPDTWLWRRGDGFATAVNLGNGTATVEGVTGAVAIATNRGGDGKLVDGQITLGRAKAR